MGVGIKYKPAAENPSLAGRVQVTTRQDSIARKALSAQAQNPLPEADKAEEDLTGILETDADLFLTLTLKALGIPPSIKGNFNLELTLISSGEQQWVFAVDGSQGTSFVVKVGRKDADTFSAREFQALEGMAHSSLSFVAPPLALGTYSADTGTRYYYSQERLPEEYEQVHPFYNIETLQYGFYVVRGTTATFLAQKENAPIVQEVIANVTEAHLRALMNGRFFLPFPSLMAGDIMANLQAPEGKKVRWVGCLNPMQKNKFPMHPGLELLVNVLARNCGRLRTVLDANRELVRDATQPYPLHLFDKNAFVHGMLAGFQAANINFNSEMLENMLVQSFDAITSDSMQMNAFMPRGK